MLTALWGNVSFFVAHCKLNMGIHFAIDVSLFLKTQIILYRNMKFMKWSPPGKRKRGRPKLTWAEGIRSLMGETGLTEEDWNDRGNWRKKII